MLPSDETAGVSPERLMCPECGGPWTSAEMASRSDAAVQRGVLRCAKRHTWTATHPRGVHLWTNETEAP